MEVIIPEYYYRFSCIAGSCPDSCCKEWAVDVDEVSAQYYRSLAGDLGNRLRQVLKDTEDSTVMEIENGRCPMWRQDGLCRIHAELGHDALCQVCQDFPRLRHDYGSCVELGLEMSCPEAARLILSTPNDEVRIQPLPNGEPASDPEALDILLRTRSVALNFLENRTHSLPQTLAILLLYGYRAQEMLDGGEDAVLDPETLLENAREFAGAADIGLVFDFLKGLEILTSQWAEDLAAPASPRWTEEIRRFARYMIRRYWLQAVADYDLVCRVKFMVTACLTVAHLALEPITAAQRFSKEIENDPDNVEALLDGAYTCPALTDVHLLGLLMH